MDIDSSTTIISSTSDQSSHRMFINGRLNQRFSHLNLLKDYKEENENEQHLSDIEGRTHPDGKASEADHEELRQLFGISHALETFHDYQEIKQSINQENSLPIFYQKEKIRSSLFKEI